MKLLNRFTYRQKNYGLLLLLIVLLVTVYFNNIKDTIRLQVDNQNLETVLLESDDAPNKLAIVRSNLKSIDSQLSSYVIDSIHDQEYLLAVASDFCSRNNLKVRGFPKAISEMQGDYMVVTNVLEVQGDFKNLLKLLYQLEQKEKVGRLGSAKFAMSKDRILRKDILTLTIHFQKIKIL